MLTSLANPAQFMRFSAVAMPLCAVIAAAAFAIGLPWALIYSPGDYQQGETVRIMYVHVPAAWWGLSIYLFMGVASFVSFVWRHPLADLAARAAAPIGATYTALCLITGSLWGAPTWGTWWEWDGRLTSMLVLFIIYLGYIALRGAIEDEERSARLGAVLCMVGLINLPIVHYSVVWWSTLHQPASIFRPGGAAVDKSMLGPLFTMVGAYLALGLTLGLMNMRAAIFRRRVENAQLRGAQP
jgi:heme exporter protein C